MDKVIELIQKDELRRRALDCVFKLNLPQCYIAAGFVRNLVWDHLHNKQVSTPINDVDVIYFDTEESSSISHLAYENRLEKMMPEFNWQVRNQANMHERNHDIPYLSTLDAMSYWPEKETAVGIRKLKAGRYECISAFGFDSLFHLNVTHNSKRDKSLFDKRIISKNWLVHWPQLIIKDS